jgi:hypothetical protein
VSSEAESAAPPQPVYRSREAALRQRIASVEAEIRELRAELGGLPEVRLRRVRWALGALTTVLVLVALVVLFARRPDRFTFTPMEHNSGWTLTFGFEAPIECLGVIVERRDGGRERVDCTTMQTAPSVAQAGLTVDQGKNGRTITVEYETRGVFSRKRHVTTPFDPMASRIAQAKQILTIVAQWVEAKPQQERRLLYFSHLLSYGYVLSEIRYGLDDGPLDRTVRFAPRSTMGIITDGDELYSEIAPSVHSVSIVITFLDGTTMTRTVVLT